VNRGVNHLRVFNRIGSQWRRVTSPLFWLVVCSSGSSLVIPWAPELVPSYVSLLCGPAVLAWMLVRPSEEPTRSWKTSATRSIAQVWVVTSLAALMLIWVMHPDEVPDPFLSINAVRLPIVVVSIPDLVIVWLLLKGGWWIVSRIESSGVARQLRGALVVVGILSTLGVFAKSLSLQDCARVFDVQVPIAARAMLTSGLATSFWSAAVFPAAMLRDWYPKGLADLLETRPRSTPHRGAEIAWFFLPILVAVLVVLSKGVSPVLERLSLVWWVRKIFAIGLNAGIPEEIVWRLGVGCVLLDQSEASGRNPRSVAMWLTSSCLFAAMHLNQGVEGCAVALILGAACWYIFISGRSLTGAILCHVAMDAILVRWWG